MKTRFTALLLALFFFILMKPRAFATDVDEQGPGLFYYSQYEHEPWREPGSARKLLMKSGELTVALVLLEIMIRRKKKSFHRP